MLTSGGPKGRSVLQLNELQREVVSCRRCPRLVAWREKVAREKRAAYSGEDYWGRPVPGFGDPDAHGVIFGLVGFIFAAVLGLLLLFAIIRSGRL